ncbi:MAG: DUF4831 family protein [Bacteroidales bacterium]|nr:DUF4831 family protein [Bacteroidales bacterium]
MKKLLFVFSLFMMSLGLNAQFVTTSAKDLTESDDDGMFYYLPRNVIKLEFTVEQTDYYIGPYAEFASKMLGLTDFVKEQKTEFAIKDVDIQISNEADPNALYCVVDERGKDPMQSLLVDDDGIILAYGFDSIPSDVKMTRNVFKYSDFTETEKPVVSFVEILDKDFEPAEDEEEKDDEEEEGGGENTKKKSTAKMSKEDKAKAVVEKIAKLRNTYFELVSGYQEVSYGEAIKFMAESMKNIENEYVSLFKGKVVKSIYKKTFYITPESNQAGGSATVAKLSGTDGLVDANGKGDAVKIHFENINTLSNISQLKEKKRTRFDNILFYRIPAKSNVKITLGNVVLAEKKLNISQFGIIRPIGIKNNKVLFNPNTGQIISILKQEIPVKN